MTRIEALELLVGKIEEGCSVGTEIVAKRIASEARNCGDMFPWNDVFKSFHGDVNSAMSFHDLFLRDWVIHRIGQRHGGVWEAIIMQTGPDGWHNAERGDKRISVFNSDPARALVLADLKGIIAQEKAHD